MKRTYVILLSLLLSMTTANLFAQRLNGGIRIESNTPIEVFVDGVKVCNPVYSCMITNLRRGTYLVEAFAISSDRGGVFSQLVFSERVHYSGFDIKDIVVRTDDLIDNSYLRPMDNRTFEELLQKVKNASFNSDRKRIIEMAATNSLFTTNQVRILSDHYSFDSEKLWLLKFMYPLIVDRDRAFLLQDILSFSSSKEEFVKFAEDFDRRALYR
ncbi:hypothetical protein HW49_01915 [Porphyromonadaceae bacterium COT-184 OH4590]|nr:hypothetical protein HW49_01915 [Porphyromonadaceae bacterium COT-184 OH4590]